MSPSKEHLHVYINGGHMDFTLRGTLDILPMGIYVNDNFMAKIISLKEVTDYFQVIMDTKEDHRMLVHYSEDKS